MRVYYKYGQHGFVMKKDFDDEEHVREFMREVAEKDGDTMLSDVI